MKKNIVVVIFLFILLFINISVLATNDYDHKFIEYYGNASITDAISAIRGSSSSEINNVGVISKNNQPRTGGTNPHRGTDFYSPEYTNVYPMLSGTVYFIDSTNNYQQKHVVIKSTINNIDYYFRYMHMEPASYLYVGKPVTQYDLIGTVQEQIQIYNTDDVLVFEGYVPHLHIQCMDWYEWDSYAWEYIGNTLKLYPFFVNNSAYNYGNDMDVITGVRVTGNLCYFNAYIRSDNWQYAGGKNFICQNIKIYYRVNSQDWSVTQVYDLTSANLINSTTFLYEIDFDDIDGLNIECGDCIDFYILANRDPLNGDDNTFYGASYTHAYFPMYYRKPPSPSLLITDTNYQVHYITYVDTNSHDWTAWSVTTPSTCCTYGTERRECIRTGCDHYEERSLPLNSSNHSGGSHWETVSNPTCTTQGSERQVCNGCAAVLSTQSIPAPGHSIGSWYTVTASTCYTNGTQRRDCSNCSYYEESSLPLNSSNHSGGSHWEVVTNPTCTASGSKNLLCNGCSAILNTSSIPAPGHSMGSWYTVTASTCYTNGTQRRDCSNCSYYEESSLPFNASNHSGGSYWTITTTATCTTSGIRSQICYGCYGVLSTQPITALGHSWGSWIYQYQYYDEDLQYYVRVYKRTCSRCGAYEYDYLD